MRKFKINWAAEGVFYIEAESREEALAYAYDEAGLSFGNTREEFDFMVSKEEDVD